MRRQRGFYANAGVHAGDVEGYAVLDAQVRFPGSGSAAHQRRAHRHQPTRTTVTRSSSGRPEIGRLVVASLTHAFR